ncbi:acid protease [Aureobasidium subglaciale]|nr:acid protease [Aureobasidium subglaciale]
MKYSTSLPLLVVFAPSALATGTLEFSLRSEPHSQPSHVAERDVDGTSESAVLTNFAGQLGMKYFVNFTVGTPGQLQTAILDTGSADTILIPSNAPFCNEKGSKCLGGTYNASASSTFEMITLGAIDAQYGETGTDSGFVADLATDVIQVGDVVVSGAHFGIAGQAKGNFLGDGSYAGIMGLGYSTMEAVKEGRPLYPTFVESLVGAGAIASRIFSLYLNEVSSYGSILFGGVDPGKYTGNLTTLNLLQAGVNEEMVQAFFMHLDEVWMKRGDGTEEVIATYTEISEFVYPDSGASDWTVPTNIYNRVVNLTGVTVTQDNAVLACSKISNDTSFTFTLSGSGSNTAKLNVPLSSFFIPAVKTDGSIAKIGGEDACLMMIKPAAPGSKVYLIGDPILRAGYWVFDLDNGQVSIAQARLSATNSNIVAVGAGPHGVMDATNQPPKLGINQTQRVAGTATASVSYSLTTAANAVGKTSGPQSTDISSGAISLLPCLSADSIMSLTGALLMSVTFGAFTL